MHLSATGTGTISGADTVLWTVNINTGASSAVLTLRNGTVGGSIIAVIDATTKSSHAFGTLHKTGIYYDLSGGNADVTIGYA